jgi:Spy/CpxP family protein refolding chaperone
MKELFTNMKKAITTLLLTSAFATAILFAQGPGGPPDPAKMVQRRVNMLTKVLTLTTDQQAQATTIFTNALTANSGLTTNMKTARQNLRTAVEGNDAGAIASNSNTIGTLTGQLTAAVANTQAAFWAILTPAQQTTLKALETSGRGPLGGGPGPFGGGPGRRGPHGGQ